MTNQNFSEANIKIAEHQEEYKTVYAFYNKDEGSVTMCFSVSDEELDRIKATNEIYIKLLTFGRPMQPIAMSCNKEDLIPKECLK